MSRGHPSDAQLARWAEAGKGKRAASHAIHCLLCERRLETITELAPRLREQLAASLEPPGTFEQRLQERLSQRLLDHETIALVTDLVDVGPETTRLLLEARERDEDDE
ncbi:MAG: hypothetical protein LBI49_07680 [Nocardiopsaceae bacterium]|jgi:hypothetical protein|nr:hypothetical protein [Nocardiopsaceae bacterium]